MSKRIRALINPDLLIWARESMGYTQESVAKKMHVNLNKIKDWETGLNYPTIIQLRKLGHIYKRPIAIFFLPKRPKDFAPLRDFRCIRARSGKQYSVALNYAVRQAYERRLLALDLYEETDENIPSFTKSVSTDDNPEKIGLEIRNMLGITKEKQINWYDSYDALNMWRSAMEQKGVLVFQSSGIDVEEMRGFAIGEYPLPAISLNMKDTPNGRIFTLLHEFVHIMLKESSVCDIREWLKRTYEDQKVEVFCNQVAGATLVNKQDLLTEDIVHQKFREKNWQKRDFTLIARRFKVSREVIMRRFLTFGWITQAYYERRRDEFLLEYEDIRKKKRTGFAPMHKKVVGSVGLSYSELVLNSYNQRLITLNTLSNYLGGVHLKHLPKIQEEVFNRIQRLRAQL